MLRERFNQDKISLWGHSLGSGFNFELHRVDFDPYSAFFASVVRPDLSTSQRLDYAIEGQSREIIRLAEQVLYPLR